ncbi:hypothetical protein OAN12_07215 [Halioglobus sp.]|nr:hypothetical protein [Halioglobus sp.]
MNLKSILEFIKRFLDALVQPKTSRAANEKEMQSLRRENEQPSIRNKMLKSALEHKTSLLKKRASIDYDYELTLEKLAVAQKKLNLASESNIGLTQLLEQKEKEVQLLQKKLARVSEIDWKQITQREKDEERKVYEDLSAERNIVNCKCLGEVENCKKCYGRGRYTVDGFGNVI